MLTKEQVLQIGKKYIIPLFSMSASLFAMDPDPGEIANGHCFYYAEMLTEFLQGSGKIVSFNSSHYFVEYDGNYYDGVGSIVHDDETITLWNYEQYNSSYYGYEKYDKKDLYYQGTNPHDDLYAGLTKNKDKNDLWEIIRIGFEPIKDELISKLHEAKNNPELFEKLLDTYYAKSASIITSECKLDKTEDGNYDAGKVTKIKARNFDRTLEELYKAKLEIEKYKKSLIFN